MGLPMRLLSLIEKKKVYTLSLITFTSGKGSSTNATKERGREKEKKNENQEKALREKEAWGKSVPPHKVNQKEEKIENKLEKILLFEPPSSLLFCKGIHKFFSKKSSWTILELIKL